MTLTFLFLFLIIPLLHIQPLTVRMCLRDTNAWSIIPDMLQKLHKTEVTTNKSIMSSFVLGANTTLPQQDIHVSNPVMLSDRQVDKLRSQGHQLPKRVIVPKRSPLSARDRIYCLKKLFILRDIVWKGMLEEGVPPETANVQIKSALRGGSWRFRWEKSDPRASWYNRFVANDKRLRMFLDETWNTTDGAAQEGEFANVFDQWCEPTMSRMLLDLTVTILEMEDRGAPQEEVQKFVQGVVRGGIKDLTEEDRRIPASEVKYVGPLGKAQYEALLERNAFVEKHYPSQ